MVTEKYDILADMNKLPSSLIAILILTAIEALFSLLGFMGSSVEPSAFIISFILLSLPVATFIGLVNKQEWARILSIIYHLLFAVLFVFTIISIIFVKYSLILSGDDAVSLFINDLFGTLSVLVSIALLIPTAWNIVVGIVLIRDRKIKEFFQSQE